MRPKDHSHDQGDARSSALSTLYVHLQHLAYVWDPLNSFAKRANSIKLNSVGVILNHLLHID